MNMPRLSWLPLIVTAVAYCAAAAPTHFTMGRPSGPPVDWYLDRQSASGKQGILVIAQGSGCASVVINRNVEAAKSLLPDFTVVTVEKYGVAPGAAPGGQADCSQAYWAHHTVTQRVEDYSAVIGRLKKAAWWNGKLVLFGGSEGGAVVQILAARVNADASVIFSSATGIPFRDAFVQVIPPELAVQAPSQLEWARRNPLSPEVWGGNSLRWWSRARATGPTPYRQRERFGTSSRRVIETISPTGSIPTTITRWSTAAASRTCPRCSRELQDGSA
jgi:hypothetical protein